MDSMAILSSSSPPLCRSSPKNAASSPAWIWPLRRGGATRARTAALRLTALKSPRGFGPAPVNRGKKKQRKTGDGVDDDDEEDEFSDEEDGSAEEQEAATVPEVVTNRMMRRMGVTVGAPLSLGLLFFPFFYYLRVVAKIDVPTWVPLLVSFFFFGTALLGISYGIASTSWDPLREGSFLGWNEAQRNWPVFWNSIRGGGPSEKTSRSRRGKSRK